MQMSLERPEVEIHMHANCNAWLQPSSDGLRKWNQIMMVYNKADLGLENYRLVYFGPVMGFWRSWIFKEVKKALEPTRNAVRKKKKKSLCWKIFIRSAQGMRNIRSGTVWINICLCCVGVMNATSTLQLLWEPLTLKIYLLFHLIFWCLGTWRMVRCTPTRFRRSPGGGIANRLLLCPTVLAHRTAEMGSSRGVFTHLHFHHILKQDLIQTLMIIACMLLRINFCSLLATRSQGEQCDDKNTINGDGCSSQCRKEPFFNCISESIREPKSPVSPNEDEG